jgi:23S rRNA (guanosine2251-2'-O)-methyltransferase
MNSRGDALRGVARAKKAAAGREILYGRQPVYEALRAGRRRVFRLFAPREPRPSEELQATLALADESGVPVATAERRQLDEWLGRVNHQGMAAEVSAYPYVAFAALCEPPAAGGVPFLLLLDHLEDPQNLGSLLRTADAVGVQGVVIPADRAVGVTPAVVRASAGAAEHVAVCVVVNLARAMRELREADLQLIGVERTPQATAYTAADLRPPLALVIGSEGRGLGRLVRETCDRLIRIPMHGRVGSLNVGVAGALALYEVRRQRAAVGNGGAEPAAV